MNTVDSRHAATRLIRTAGSPAAASSLVWAVAVRQIAYRARAHIAARRPRGAVSAAETRAALTAFQRAVDTGDLRNLLDILAPDVVLLTDGGGVVRAATAPVVGSGPVAEVLGRIVGAAVLRPARINGHPALIIELDGAADTVVAMRIDEGLITGLYAVRNPVKLARLERETPLRR